jgi:dTDP-4-dehydrorhamnose reductase
MDSELLITGSYGQLGRSVVAGATFRSIPAEGRDLDTLDITDPRAVNDWITSSRPRAVINCAAYTAVDDCETHETEALEVNATAVSYLADACNEAGATLIQISTDYVFDGTASEPYGEDDPVAPTSAYGRTKLRGEQAARTADHHLIVRTAWLYGHGGQHFVGAIKRQIGGGAIELRVVDDQHGSPTFSDDLAAAILDLVEADARGTVHAVNNGITSWYGFAQEIVRLLDASVRVHPVTTAEFSRPASRPAFSGLDTSRLEKILGRPMPAWQDALARYLGAT